MDTDMALITEEETLQNELNKLNQDDMANTLQKDIKLIDLDQDASPNSPNSSSQVKSSNLVSLK